MQPHVRPLTVECRPTSHSVLSYPDRGVPCLLTVDSPQSCHTSTMGGCLPACSRKWLVDIECARYVRAELTLTLEPIRHNQPLFGISWDILRLAHRVRYNSNNSNNSSVARKLPLTLLDLPVDLPSFPSGRGIISPTLTAVCFPLTAVCVELRISFVVPLNCWKM